MHSRETRLNNKTHQKGQQWHRGTGTKTNEINNLNLHKYKGWREKREHECIFWMNYNLYWSLWTNIALRPNLFAFTENAHVHLFIKAELQQIRETESNNKKHINKLCFFCVCTIDSFIYWDFFSFLVHISMKIFNFKGEHNNVLTVAIARWGAS